MGKKYKQGFVTQQFHITLGDKTIWHVSHSKHDQYWCGNVVDRNPTEQFKTLREALEWLLKSTPST